MPYHSLGSCGCRRDRSDTAPCGLPLVAYLGVWQAIQGLLIRRVRLLQVVHHQVAVPERTPDLAILLRDVEHSLVEFDGLEGGVRASQSWRSQRART